MRSHTDLDFYIMQGEVPETMMLGGTSYISQFCEHGFYDWVTSRYKPIKYPDENPVLGRYLGTAIDVSAAMTAKIMNVNRYVVHRSTYRVLK